MALPTEPSTKYRFVVQIETDEEPARFVSAEAVEDALRSEGFTGDMGAKVTAVRTWAAPPELGEVAQAHDFLDGMSVPRQREGKPLTLAERIEAHHWEQ